MARLPGVAFMTRGSGAKRVLGLCAFPGRFMAEVAGGRGGHTGGAECSHFGVFGVVN